MRVLLLAGGRSAEWEISLMSAKWVAEELRNAGHTVHEVVINQNGTWTLKTGSKKESISFRTDSLPWAVHTENKQIPVDVVFPVLHGAYGEDGTVQGLCATAGWPCAGVPVMGSAVAMEKNTMKLLASRASIPVVPWVFLGEDPQECFDCLSHEIKDLGFPLFVKPSRLGSSVGISRVDSLEHLPEALKKATSYDSHILVEKGVENPREIEVSVIGNGTEVVSSVPGEVLPGREWYDYQAKYHCEDSRLSIPAELPASIIEDIRMYAEKAFRLLGGRGFARVDFLLNKGGVWLNEINTIPGFTRISMFPKLFAASGINSGELLDYILDEAVSRKEYGLWTETENE